MLDEKMKEKVRQNFKENYILRIKATLISLAICIVLIVFGFLMLPVDAGFIWAGIAFACWIIFSIAFSISNSKKANRLNKRMEEKYLNGEITKEDYGEFVKEESKAKNIAYIALTVIFVIRIIIRLMQQN